MTIAERNLLGDVNIAETAVETAILLEEELPTLKDVAAMEDTAAAEDAAAAEEAEEMVVEVEVEISSTTRTTQAHSFNSLYGE